MDDQIDIFCSQMPISRIDAALIELARNKTEPKAIDRRDGCRRGTSSSNRAHLATRDKAIPILAARLQSSSLDMDGVSQIFGRDIRSFLDDFFEFIIRRDFPAHWNVFSR